MDTCKAAAGIIINSFLDPDNVHAKLFSTLCEKFIFQDSLLDYSLCLTHVTECVWSGSRDSISVCGVTLTNSIIDKKNPLRRAR